MSGSQSKFSGKLRSASRLSARASVKSATDITRNPKMADFSNSLTFKLQKIVEVEDSAMVVYAVREDLLQRVMEECNSRYLEKQTVKFLADCACTALKQIIDLNFFVHDFGQPYYENHPSWSGDLPPEPSPPDTWASGNVPVVTESDDLLSKEEEEAEEKAVVVENEPVPSASAEIVEEDPVETKSETEAVFPEEEFGPERRVSFKGSHHSITLEAPHVSEIFEEEPELEEVFSKKRSLFADISRCIDVSAEQNESVSERPGPKIPKLPRVPAEKKCPRTVEVFGKIPKLPPIRAEVTLRKASYLPDEDAKLKK